jgi:hypothetical protein
VTPEVTDAALAAMTRYGGSFAKTLARLYAVADADNRDRLRAAFADLFTTYARLAAAEADR